MTNPNHYRLKAKARRRKRCRDNCAQNMAQETFNSKRTKDEYVPYLVMTPRPYYREDDSIAVIKWRRREPRKEK